MDSSIDNASELPTQDGKTQHQEYDELIEKYYELARERATLETDELESDSTASLRYAKVVAEMDSLETDLAELLEGLDETDFEALFMEVDR